MTPRTKLALKLAAFALGIVVVALLPRYVSDFRAFELHRVGLFFIAVLGLNVVTGYTGQISLGHGAFMAIGGYTTAILMTKLHLQDVVTIPLAGLAGGLAGLAFGLPALRLSGLYLALATFGIAISTPSVIRRAEGLTGGTTGLNLFAIPEQTGLGIEVRLLGRTLTFNDWLYYLTWGIAVVLFALAWALLASRFGRAFRATRDSEVAAASSGVNLAATKTLAFGVSAFYAGVAGSLLAIGTAFVDPNTFPIALSITLLVGAAVGGLGSLVGPVVGALFVVYMPILAERFGSEVGGGLPAWAQRTVESPAVVYAVVLIVLMLVLPSGAGGLLGRASLPRGRRADTV
ncbi:MAG: branched-chain amino acid ABC transporter permease [Actinomycetota bacterium]|nr:branched-chain amino acid ABC transporter permease [Actinomycetota bacterium]